MTLKDFNFLTFTGCIEEYKPLTKDMTEDENTCCNRSALNFIFDPDTIPIQHQ